MFVYVNAFSIHSRNVERKKKKKTQLIFWYLMCKYLKKSIKEPFIVKDFVWQINSIFIEIIQSIIFDGVSYSKKSKSILRTHFSFYFVHVQGLDSFFKKGSCFCCEQWWDFKPLSSCLIKDWYLAFINWTLNFFFLYFKNSLGVKLFFDYPQISYCYLDFVERNLFFVLSLYLTRIISNIYFKIHSLI